MPNKAPDERFQRRATPSFLQLCQVLLKICRVTYIASVCLFLQRGLIGTRSQQVGAWSRVVARGRAWSRVPAIGRRGETRTRDTGARLVPKCLDGARAFSHAALVRAFLKVTPVTSGFKSNRYFNKETSTFRHCVFQLIETNTLGMALEKGDEVHRSKIMADKRKVHNIYYIMAGLAAKIHD